MEQRTAAVSVRNVTKRFGPVLANDKVCLDIYRGEILALLGENGSGKTTLMNMLSGIYYPDEGEIYINGKPVSISSPKESFHLGIGMIHQHFKLVDVFTAAENIILGLDEKLDMKSAIRKIRKICDQYGFDIDPNQKIYDMSVSQKQTVEIVKVLYRGADILIAADCTAYAFAGFHERFIAGRTVIIACPKLDATDYSEKLQQIFMLNNIKSIVVTRMQVPCCGGLVRMVQAAMERSRKSIPCEVYTISNSGQILNKETI